MGQIITVSCIKGGSGKTTLTVCIAAHAAIAHGLKVAILDLDGPQHQVPVWVGSDTKLARTVHVETEQDIRLRGENVAEAVARLNRDYDLVFIDIVGADSGNLMFAIRNCDRMYVPISDGSPLDFASVFQVEARIKAVVAAHKREVDWKVVFNKTHPRANVYRRVLGFAIERGWKMAPEVRYSGQFLEAALLNTTPSMPGAGRKSGRQAKAYLDIKALTDFILADLGWRVSEQPSTAAAA